MQAKAGDRVGARRTFDLALKAAQSIKVPHDQAVAMLGIAKYLVELEKFGRKLKCLECGP